MSSLRRLVADSHGRRREAWHIAAPAWVAGKAATLLVTLLTVWRQGTGSRPGRGAVLDALSYWDGQSYLHIATSGYPAGPLQVHAGQPGHYWGFFPGYPILLHAVDLILAAPQLSGVVVSAVAELVALVLVARLVLDIRGDVGQARVCVWLVALHPYAVFLTAVYTESAFLAAAAGALLLARRGRLWLAWVAAAAAVAIRVTGLALIPALLWECLRHRRGRPGPELAGVAVALAPLALFLLWARHETGSALAYFDIERSESFGNRNLVNPIDGLRATWSAATATGSGSNSEIFTLEVLFGVAGFVVVLAMVATRLVTWLAPRWGRTDLATPLRGLEVPVASVIYCAGAWLLPVSVSYWLSVPRYSLALFPALLLVAGPLARRPALAWTLIGISAVLMGFATSVFAAGDFLA